MPPGVTRPIAKLPASSRSTRFPVAGPIYASQHVRQSRSKRSTRSSRSVILAVYMNDFTQPSMMDWPVEDGIAFLESIFADFPFPAASAQSEPPPELFNLLLRDPEVPFKRIIVKLERGTDQLLRLSILPQHLPEQSLLPNSQHPVPPAEPIRVGGFIQLLEEKFDIDLRDLPLLQRGVEEVNQSQRIAHGGHRI